MRGFYKEGKIHHKHSTAFYLTKGNWKDGFSGIETTKTETSVYEILSSSKILEEGKFYKFELVNGFAKIL